ncbi:MAG: hypothetical protein WDO16_21665 [Bacteroidota bacterium]
MKQILLAGMVSMTTVSNMKAQVTGNAAPVKDYELSVLNQLGSPTAVVNMPVSQLLNAPGNEALRAFFFTPIKDATVLKGKKIAVLAADGFEEIELLGPVWYFRQLGATVDIVAPKYVPAPERYGLIYPELAKTHIMAIQYLQP